MSKYAMILFSESKYDHDEWRVKDYRTFMSLEEAQLKFDALVSWSKTRVGGIQMVVFDRGEDGTPSIVFHKQHLNPLKKLIEINPEAKPVKEKPKSYASILAATQQLTIDDLAQEMLVSMTTEAPPSPVGQWFANSTITPSSF